MIVPPPLHLIVLVFFIRLGVLNYTLRPRLEDFLIRRSQSNNRTGLSVQIFLMTNYPFLRDNHVVGREID